MDLQELRGRIDGIDDALIDLFQRRMNMANEVARYKQRHGMPILDPVREEQKLRDLSGKAEERYRPYVAALYALIFELSRAEQEKTMKGAR